MNAKMNMRRARHQKEPLWDLCLYVADRTPRSLLAIGNLTDFCETEFAGHYHLEVIDVVAQPQIARAENIVAVPTLVRKKPAPLRRVIGDLSDRKRMVTGLEIRARL